MNRRDLLASPLFALLACELGGSLTDNLLAAPPPPQSFFQYGNAVTPAQLRTLLSGGRLDAAGGPTAVVLVNYDRTTSRFVKASDVVAQLDGSKQYTLDVTIRGGQLRPETLRGLQGNNLQIALNASVLGQSTNDSLTWLIYSAIDVFGDPKNIKGNLLSFSKDSPPTTSVLPAAQPIVVDKGRVALGLEIAGHKKASEWQTVFSILSKVSSAAFMGQFGLPVLATETLQFITGAMTKLTANSPLVPVLAAKPVTYTVQKGLNGPDDVWKLATGWWIALSYETASSTKFLQDYVINFDDPNTLPVVKRADGTTHLDADSMVLYLNFAEKTSTKPA